MSDELEIRASDAEREHAVARLRQAAADGRLTLEELADRSALAYRARSHADLDWEDAGPGAPFVRVRAFGLVGEVKVIRR